MSKYLLKTSPTILGAAMPIALIAALPARSQSKEDEREAQEIEEQLNKTQNQIRKVGKAVSPSKSGSPSGSPSESPSTSPSTSPIPTEGITTVGNNNYTFAIPTPVLIMGILVVGGIALFPVVHLLIHSQKKALELGKSSFWSKLTKKYQKPQVLESDAFLHQRNFEKLSQIVDRAASIDADKFDNGEFTAFFKIKSYITRSVGEYANLDEIVSLLNAAIAAQNSFAAIDSIESRNCSSAQQEVYKLTNALLAEGVESQDFIAQIELKIQEVTPRLQTEEGKAALATYIGELKKISQHPLALKLLLLFKQYQLADYSILKTVSNKIGTLEKENLLDLDSLMVLVMTEYETFEKLGPILGIAPEYNRPETYSKLLQYIGLKSRHEASYGKFKDFLTILKPWEQYCEVILAVRKKYAGTEYQNYQIPKEFKIEPPGLTMYQKYKDSFHLLEDSKIPAPSGGTIAETSELSSLSSGLAGVK